MRFPISAWPSVSIFVASASLAIALELAKDQCPVRGKCADAVRVLKRHLWVEADKRPTAAPPVAGHQVDRGEQAEPLDNRWKQPHYALYAVKGAQLDPEQVFELVVELRDIYKPYKDSQTNGRKARIESLWEAGQVSLKNCYSERFKGYEILMRYYSIYRINVLHYLRHFHEAQTKLCVENFGNLLRRAVESLREDHKTDMALLADAIHHSNSIVAVQFARDHSIDSHDEHTDPGAWSLEEIAAGMVRFIDQKTGSLNAKDFPKTKLSRKRFDELIERNVIRTCTKWSKQMEPVFAIIQLDVELKLSQRERKWINYAILCERILAKRATIEEGAFKFLQDLIGARARHGPIERKLRSTLAKGREMLRKWPHWNRKEHAARKTT